ncbi:MAG: translation elongation factor-like protein [Candidatus Paceibacterota bacterium]|jgi:translation initiation factor IF-2
MKEKKEKKVGEVIHYYSKITVAVIKFSVPVEVGDTIHFKGHTTDFSQKIDSIQIDYKPVEKVKAKQEAAMKVDDHVREGDVIYLAEE